MNTSLRLILITMTVGGGFTGVAVTLQALLSPQGKGPASAVICLVFLLLYLFVLISGLLFVQNPRRMVPLVVALALQVPAIYSPIIAFRFVAGFNGTAGISETGVFWWVRLGSEWQLNLLQPLPWGVGINFVAVILLAALAYSIGRRNLVEQAMPCGSS